MAEKSADEGFPEEPWSSALDALEDHIGEIRAGLQVGELPEPYAVGVPSAPLPPQLSARARQVLASHRDLEEEVRSRLAVLASVLAGAPASPSPQPVYVDRRN